MNEEQYHKLCEACDRVLMAPDSTIERVAIPWLHVIREHPVFLENYKDLFADITPDRFVSYWQRTTRNLMLSIRQILKSVGKSKQLWFSKKQLPEHVDVLFISHLLNNAQAGKADDFYFGEIPEKMSKQGCSVVIALVNFSGEDSESLSSKWKEDDVQRVLLSNSLGFASEVALIRQQRSESKKLTTIAKNQAKNLYRRVIERASQEAKSDGTRFSLRLAKQVSSLVASTNPKVVIVIHEGHSWERVAFASARQIKPDVKCVGYQHALLSRLQHALLRSLKPEYNPDQILASGTDSMNRLKENLSTKGIGIVLAGSNRGIKSDNKFIESPSHQNSYRRSERRVCLVIPEGIVSECNMLFEFSFMCALVYPAIQFIWRLHPCISFDTLISKNHKLRNLPTNVILSDQNFSTDLERCDYALYRGSTAIVEAVGASLKPIYLGLPGELLIDPLYKLAAWRENITNSMELNKIVGIENNRGLVDDLPEFLKAIKHCQNLYSPIDINVFKNAIM